LKKNDLIIQHNDLISGKYNWTVNEIKIVLKSISLLKSESDLTFKISKNDLVKLLSDNNYSNRDLKNLSRRLYSKIFEIQGKNKEDWTLLSWFSKLEYKNGIFFIKFNEEMKPYLFNLKKNFTKFNLQNILPMKSNYSMRIYQLLKQYQKIGYRNFTLDKLREILKIPDSYLYANIKNTVILKAQKEMEEHSDITFEFEEIKTGRKITDIKFIIKKKKDHKDIFQEDKEKNPWYYAKYYERDIIQSEIEYKCITDIIEKDNILIVTFKDGDSIKVKDENTLLKLIQD